MNLDQIRNSAEQEFRKLLKQNAIEMVTQHKKLCDNDNCGVSTYLILILIEKAGILLTDEERSKLL